MFAALVALLLGLGLAILGLVLLVAPAGSQKICQELAVLPQARLRRWGSGEVAVGCVLCAIGLW